MISGEICILQWLEELRTPIGNLFWEGITLFGEDVFFIVFVAIIYFIFNKKLAYRICFLCAASLGLNGILKNILCVPRPFSHGDVTCVRPDTATGYSFPSGHTQTAATWSMAIASYQRKKSYLVISVLLSLMVGFSRLYLGAHYLSDVCMAVVLGWGIGWAGNLICNRCSEEKKLHAAVLLFMTPFLIWFLWKGDPLSEDFFKCYGLLAGFLPAVRLEEKSVQLSWEVPLWKRILRLFLGVSSVFLLKLGLSQIPVSSQTTLFLLWSGIRCSLLTFAVFGLYPLLLKKIRL